MVAGKIFIIEDDTMIATLIRQCLNKFDKFEYIFSSSLLRRNKIDQDNDQFIKFIQLVRKIIIDILKNDVKYY